MGTKRGAEQKYDFVPGNKIIQDDARRSAPGLKGMDVAEEEVLQALVEEELHPEGATVREGEEESGKTAAGTTERDFAEVSPIGLSLLAGEGVEAEESLAARRTDLGHDPAQLHDAAGVAALANHLVEASGAQARMALESFA
jgi:hypothetical protein